jgi:DNA polymerase (family X)
MKAADAQTIADELVRQLRGPDPCCDDVIVAGSLRRRRPNVADIDLVVLPTAGNVLFVKNRLWKIYNARPEKFGDKYCCLANYKGIQVDVYIAEPATFATLTLIRTGSKEHNILLAQRAQELALHLNASGHGLTDMRSGKPIPIDSETDFFAALKMPYKEPWEREA